MSKIAVIIPMFGKAEYTKKCVDMTLVNAGVTVTILVVDDGSPEPFKYEDERVFIHRLEKNSGFTAATNAGILWAQKRDYDYVLTLNNDTEPCELFAKHLLDCAEADPLIGIACSVRVHPTRGADKYELVGSDLIRGYQYFTDAEGLAKFPAFVEANWIPICSGLIRMDMIREIGILDKRFRNHCSDSSYCLWAKINHWKVGLVPKSKVIHHMSITTTANNILVDDDQRLFLEKLAGIDYAKICQAMPLDGEAKTYGKLSFEVYKK